MRVRPRVHGGRGPCESSNPFFLVAPHSRSSPPESSALPPPLTRAPPHPRAHLQRASRLLRSPPPPPSLQAARETTRAQPWRPRVTFRGQQSFIQSRFAPHPALFKQHFFDYVAVQILVFLICTFSLFTSLSVLNPYSPQTSPAGFLAIYSNPVCFLFSPPPLFLLPALEIDR